MNTSLYLPDRRLILGAFGLALFTTRGLFAEELDRTPSRTEGPFYPDKLPLDTDNDLIVINDGITPAVGQITHLSGRVLTPNGSPVSNVTVEIWQCDANEVYINTGDSDSKKDQQDRNFQGFGRFTTGSTGEYYFRTIKPVPYPGRPAPHIHFLVKKGNREVLTSQINIAGHPGNAVDGVVNGGITRFDKELLMADFVPMAGSKLGELTAQFDIILGRTPDERAFRDRNTRVR